MATIVLDTHRLVAGLKKSGFTEQQAEGITRAIQEVDQTQVATKADLRELELRITLKLGSIIVSAVTLATTFLAILKLFD